jgi:hypothetical protein
MNTTAGASVGGRAALALAGLLGAGLAGCGGEALPTDASPIALEPAVRLDAAPVCTTLVSRGQRAPQPVYPSTAVSPDGRAIAGWRHCDGANVVAAVATFDGGQWTPPTILGLGPDEPPRVAIRAGGEALAVWRRNEYLLGPSHGPSATYESLFDPRRGWSAVRPFEEGAGALEMQPVGGGRTVLWWRYPSVDHQLQATRFLSEGRWAPAQAVDLGEIAEPSLSIAGDAEGNAVAVWLRNAPGQGASLTHTVWSARFDVRTGWDSPRALDATGRRRASGPLVALDRAGNGYVAWADGPGEIRVVRSTTASGASAPVLVDFGSAPTSADLSLERVTVDARGGAHLFWTTYGTPTLWTARFANGRQAGPPQALGETSTVEAATAPEGATVAVWSQYDVTINAFVTYTRRYVVGRGWGEAQVLPTSAGGSLLHWPDPKVAVDDQGHAFVLWVESDGESDALWVRRLRL